MYNLADECQSHRCFFTDVIEDRLGLVHRKEYEGAGRDRIPKHDPKLTRYRTEGLSRLRKRNFFHLLNHRFLWVYFATKKWIKE